MIISVCVGLRGDDKVTVDMQENAEGPYATLEVGGLSVVLSDREKALEIASLLEQAAQKWEVGE